MLIGIDRPKLFSGPVVDHGREIPAAFERGGSGAFRSCSCHPEQEYERYGIAAYGRVTEGFGVTAAYKTTSDGKNTGEVDAYTFGLVLGL